MRKALITIHSAARRQPGYADRLAGNLMPHGHRVSLYEANWADLGHPGTFGDADKFAAIRSEFFRKLGVPRLAMSFIEPRGSDPTSTPGSAFDPILLYGFIPDVRDQVQSRLREQLSNAKEEGHDTVSVVAHSMGTVVAFDLLADLADDDALPTIDLLVTLGSPLWMPFFETRHGRKLHKVGTWLNVFHPKDSIGRPLLRAFGDDGPCPPLDMAVQDDEDPDSPHSHYWASPLTARALHHAWLGLETEH
jgi:hypothetical protein